jgi:hypothetical protein
LVLLQLNILTLIIFLSGTPPNKSCNYSYQPGEQPWDVFSSTSFAQSGCYAETATNEWERVTTEVVAVASGYPTTHTYQHIRWYVDSLEAFGYPISHEPEDPMQTGPFINGRWSDELSLVPNGATPNIANVAPTDDVILTDPNVVFQVDVLARPGATDIDSLFIVGYNMSTDEMIDVFGDPAVTAGTASLPYTLPTDGYYLWQVMEMSDTDGYSYVVNNGGFFYSDYFYLDATPPVLSNLNHTPSSPTSSDPVTVSVTAQDATSGLATTKIYVDDVLEQTCNYSGTTNPQTCQVIVGPYASGTHSYYAVATDFGGLQTTSSIQNFTIATTPPVASNLVVSYANYCYAEHTFTWDYFDSGGDPQGAYQLQIDDEQTFGAPLAFDSGKVFSSSDQRSSTVSVSPTGEQLSFATTYYWRLMVWDDQDVPSVSWAYPVPPTTTTALHPYPKGDLPPFSISPPLIVQGETITFTDATTFFTAPANQSWQWTIPSATFVDGTNASSQNPHATFDTGGGRTVLLQATDEELAADPNSGTGSCAFSRSVGVFSTIPQFREIAPIIFGQ